MGRAASEVATKSYASIGGSLLAGDHDDPFADDQVIMTTAHDERPLARQQQTSCPTVQPDGTDVEINSHAHVLHTTRLVRIDEDAGREATAVGTDSNTLYAHAHAQQSTHSGRRDEGTTARDEQAEQPQWGLEERYTLRFPTEADVASYLIRLRPPCAKVNPTSNNHAMEITS